MKTWETAASLLLAVIAEYHVETFPHAASECVNVFGAMTLAAKCADAWREIAQDALDQGDIVLAAAMIARAKLAEGVREIATDAFLEVIQEAA